MNDGAENTIQLEKCPKGGYNCKEVLENVNLLLENANLYVHTKEYQKALELKEKAFTQVTQLKIGRCQPCGTLFREVILNSINIHIADLKSMSSGIFGKKKYRFHIDQAQELADRMEIYLNENGKSGVNLFNQSEE